MTERKEIKGPAAVFLFLAVILLSIAALAASWGVLWHAFVWAF